MNERIAGLSIDVDSVASHLEGYGFPRPPDDGAAYRLAIPRALDLFEEMGVRATFFLIAEEALLHGEVVRQIVDRGHEVGSHSMSHRLPFAGLGPDTLKYEIVESKSVLEEMTESAVGGFRAPSWDLSEAILEAVARAGYVYDASTYPSILLPLLRLAVRRRSHDVRSSTRSGLWEGVFGKAEPHRIDQSGRSLWEIPVSTTPLLRLPYYHTLRFETPDVVMRIVGALAGARRSTVTYQFHAVDFLDAAADGLDRRISCHPGMKMPLGPKIELARRALAQLALCRDVLPLQETIQSLEHAETFVNGPQHIVTR